MKVSELTISDIVAYLREDMDSFSTAAERRQIEMMFTAAKRYVMNYTALKEDELDCSEDITLAVLILCQDFYDNRTRNLMNNESAVNRTLEALLGFNDHNLLY